MVVKFRFFISIIFLIVSCKLQASHPDFENIIRNQGYLTLDELTYDPQNPHPVTPLTYIFKLLCYGKLILEEDGWMVVYILGPYSDGLYRYVIAPFTEGGTKLTLPSQPPNDAKLGSVHKRPDGDMQLGAIRTVIDTEPVTYLIDSVPDLESYLMTFNNDITKEQCYCHLTEKSR